MLVAIGVMNGLSWGVAILIALVVCGLFGFFSGVLINVFKVHALIATIGVTTIAKATAYIIGGGSAIYYNRIDPTINLLVYGKLYGIPFLVIIILIIYLAAAFLQNQTRVGQYLYAVGENRQAAHEAGIPEKTILYVFYILSAFMAAFGGVILSASFQAGQPNFQGSFFVDGLTAVFLGALVFKAGRPNVLGTLIGAIFIMVLGNGLTMLNVPFFYGVIIKGLLMVVGVVVITRANAVSLKYGSLKRLIQKTAAKP
jgi:ribose transport system permease protein